MKKTLIAISGALLGLAAQAGSFEGWSVSGSVEQAKNELTGSPVLVTANNFNTGISTVSGSKSSSGLKLGVAYGAKLGPTLTTFGVDLSTAKGTVNNLVAENGVTNPDPAQGIQTSVKDRMDVYVAPGFMLDNTSMVYVKLASSNFKYSYTGESGGLTGSPGKSGMSYGLGYKRFFDAKSPYFLVAEYNMGETKSGRISGNGYENTPIYLNTKNKYNSFSIGVGYSFN